MAIVEGWCPPTRENWELLVYLWQFFPLVCTASRSDLHTPRERAED